MQSIELRSELEVERLKYSQLAQLQLCLELCQQSPNTDEQQSIFDEIFEAVEREQSKVFFIQGQAGYGKLKNIMAWCRSRGKKCAGCTSTGLAATIYDEFETAPLLLEFSVVKQDEREVNVPTECQFDSNPNRYKYLKAAS